MESAENKKEAQEEEEMYRQELFKNKFIWTWHSFLEMFIESCRV